MAASRSTKRELLEQRLQGIAVIGEEMWAQLKRDLAPVSDSYLHSLLKHSGRLLAPLVEGVSTGSLDDTERTLRSLAAEYEKADPARRKMCRTVVINAKQQLRWWLRRAREEGLKRQEKQEMLLWVSTWLENPALFPDWIVLRRCQMTTEAQTTPR